MLNITYDMKTLIHFLKKFKTKDKLSQQINSYKYRNHFLKNLKHNKVILLIKILKLRKFSLTSNQKWIQFCPHCS